MQNNNKQTQILFAAQRRKCARKLVCAVLCKSAPVVISFVAGNWLFAACFVGNTNSAASIDATKLICLRIGQQKQKQNKQRKPNIAKSANCVKTKCCATWTLFCLQIFNKQTNKQTNTQNKLKRAHRKKQSNNAAVVKSCDELIWAQVTFLPFRFCCCKSQFVTRFDGAFRRSLQPISDALTFFRACNAHWLS